MGLVRYLQRALRVRSETRSLASTPDDGGLVFRPTIPGSSPASAVRRFSSVAFRVLDRRERAAFLAGSSWDSTEQLTVYRRFGRLRVAEVDPTVTPEKAYTASQQLVVDVCEQGGIDYFLVPESTSHRARIGIAQEQWPLFVDRLVELGRHRPVYAGVEGLAIDGHRRRYPGLVTTVQIERAMRSQHHLEVFVATRPGATSHVVFDRPFSCHVERWSTTESGALQAPSRNERATHVGASKTVGATTWSHGRQVRTLQPFTSPGIFEIDFPIDVVYMWVDGSDPAWVERKNEALVRAGLEPMHDGAAAERFRDNGELRYSMRSVEQFAPWVRNIYLVTDQQVPEWLDPDHPRITVVDHRDLFGEHGSVPNFNSHAIGARLHHIVGLSEHYLHFNDDFFLARPVLPQLFFTSNGSLEVLPVPIDAWGCTTRERPSRTSRRDATS